MHISRPRISFSYGRDITLDHHEILRSFVYRAIDDSLARLTFHQRLSMSISTPRMRTHTYIYIYVPVRECPLEESFLFTFRPFHTGVFLAQIENGTKLKIDRTISMLIAMKMEKEGTRADIASPTITIVQLISKIFTHFSLLPTIALSTSSYSSVSNDFTPLRDGHIPSTFILDLPKSIFCVIWVILFIFFFF